MSKEKRAPRMCEAAVAVTVLVVVLAVSLGVLKVEAHIPFIIVSIITSLMTLRMGNSWQDIRESVLDSLNSVLQAMIILIMVGMVIGTWVQGGIVPSLVYYGLKLIHPKVFLVTIFLVCSICAVATGSSWTIIGTLGAAAIGISEGLQIPVYITAGIVVSAGYFGDKLSPLSDTPNLHCAIVGVDLFENFKNVLKTTIPSYLLGLLLCVIAGIWYAPKGAGDLNAVHLVMGTLKEEFIISPWLILPIVSVFLMVVLKIPAIPGIYCMVILGALCGALIQKESPGEIMMAAYRGYIGATGVSVVDSLLTRGGITAMMPTVFLIICTVSYSGVLKVSGILDLLVGKIVKYIRRDATLILATVVTCIVVDLIAMDNYVTAVITGNMFKEAYIKQGLHPLNLSRCLAESASIVSPLIPWNTCGIVVYGMLGISPLAYAPYAFLCWIPPIMIVFLAYLNIGLIHTGDAG